MTRKKTRVCFAVKVNLNELDVFIEERQRLADAVKHHQRDRNWAPSEPAGKYFDTSLENRIVTPVEELLEAVRASLRAKVAALADDNWMYEAEDDTVLR